MDHLAFLANQYNRKRYTQEKQAELFKKQLKIRLLLEKLGKQRPDLFFVQIGANDGVLHDHLNYFIQRFAWKGLLVEPLPDCFQALQQTYAAMPGMKYENAAISDHAGTQTILRVNPAMLHQFPKWAAGCATFKDNYRNIAHCPELKEHIIREEVKTLTLPELLSKHDIAKIDLLQIDTEGYDYIVLKQLDFARYKPSVIIMEYVHLSPEEQQATRTLLDVNGYAYRMEHLDLIAARKDFLLS